MDIVQVARQTAMEAHAGQKRDGGEDYFTHHILPVANIVEEMLPYRFGHISQYSSTYFNDFRDVLLSTAYLHDVLEDCDEWLRSNSLPDVLIQFPNPIVRQDIWVSLEYLNTSGDPEEPYFVYDTSSSKTEKFVTLFREAPIEACIVKMADRMSNIQSMGGVWDNKRQLKYLKQSNEMFDMYAERIAKIPSNHHKIITATAHRIAAEFAYVYSIESTRVVMCEPSA